jgi:SAM-dependent methyltransferase
MNEAGYAAQARGDLDDYARYLRGMDASMRQKIALTAAHLLCEGRIADMGMGSGAGSHALAALYPRLEVVGVDIDATMVTLARQRFDLPNLSFQEGDIAAPTFAAASLDGIFDCSVLHHVTSYGGYRHANAEAALRAQVPALKPHGVLVVRDFLDPGPAPVLLEVPADDGADTDDPRTASTAALLERFAREFRSLSATPGFPLERLAPDARPGWRRYRLGHKHAAEFLLRKDYRADWEAEVREEYTYYTQAEFEALFGRLGLRVLASTPLWNPWIIRHRFEGRYRLADLSGAPLGHPATNYLIAGERVPAGEGVAFRAARPGGARGFLRLEHHRHRESGRVFDLAYRPHPTLDIVPFFRLDQRLFVLARTSYPRPILRAGHADCPPLDGSGAADYVTEPLNALQTEAPLGRTVEERLERAAGIRPAQIVQMLPGSTYYPSPGGILEEVRSVFVEVAPTFVNAPQAAVSGFTTSGRVRAIEAQQLLRAAQVGGLPDARLEINVHDLLLRLGLPRGPWIGDTPPVTEGFAPPTTALAVLLAGPGRRAFERVAPADSRGFLQIRATEVEELGSDGTVLAAATLESVVPGPLGTNTVSTALLARDGAGRALLGVDEDDLPAAQGFAGVSNLLVTPAWRIPREVRTLAEALRFVAERLAAEYGLEVAEPCALGGAYRPSPGLTPEVVHPYAFAVRGASGGARPLRWVPLDELVERRRALADGHLRVALLRASHALG